MKTSILFGIIAVIFVALTYSIWVTGSMKDQAEHLLERANAQEQAVIALEEKTNHLLASALVDNLEPLELAKRSGCLACHKVNTKVIGPPWMDVSTKYLGDSGARERLIKKIKKGGKGNWTEVTGGVPMPPYSPRVSDENIGRLVDFVLSLAKEKMDAI